MGALCSCTRSTPKGKTLSVDNLMDRRPMALGNGHLPYQRPTSQALLPVQDPLTVSAPHVLYSAGKPVGVVAATPSVQPPESPASTVGDKDLTLMDTPTLSKYSASETNMTTLSFSTTPTSTLVGRKKPPPKPPRMKTCLFRSKSTNATRFDRDRDTTSPGRQSLRSVLSEVTNALDTSLAGLSLDGVQAHMDMEEDEDMIKKKIYKVFAKAREVLVPELNPIFIAKALCDAEVIDVDTRDKIATTHGAVNASNMILDILLTKGHEEFLIFCDILKNATKQTNLVDLLLAIDGLLDVVASSEEATTGAYMCPTCTSKNNNGSLGDLLAESATFDLDITYCDVSAGAQMSVSDYVAEKRAREKRACAEDATPILSNLERDRLPKYKPVLSVSLFSHCLNRGGMENLSQVLAERECIRELTIAKSHLDTVGMEILGVALQKNTSLAKLDIRLNTLGDQGACSLASGLTRNSSLRSLNITSTGLSGPGCNLLASGLYRNHSLMELDIGFNDLQDSGCEVVSSVLAGNSNLRKLRMRDNNISPEGCHRIFQSLRHNSRLIVLDLSSNKVSDKSMLTLAEVLLVNRTLKELNIENCNIGLTGCMCLARALKTNTVLKVLELSMNPLGDAGVGALADGLKYNHGLDILCLNMCKVGNKGFLTLLGALKFNSTLTSLKLCYNNIGSPENIEKSATYNDDSADELVSLEVLYEKLCSVLQMNKDLKVLLWGNKFMDPKSRDSFVQ